MREAHRAFAALGAILLACAVASAADEAYAIKLERPRKVGDIYDTHITIERTMVSTLNVPGGAPQVRTQKIKGDLTGRVEALAVDEKGDLISFVLTIKTFTDGDGKELLATGKEVKIERQESQVVLALSDGGEISADVKAVLNLVYSSHPAKAVGDDAIFGSTTLRKVGESWKVNSESAAQAFIQAGINADSKKMTGEVTLEGVENSAGGHALRIVGEIDAKDITPPGIGEGTVIDRCDLKAHMNTLSPTDPSQPNSENEVTADMTMKLSQPAPIDASIKMTRKEIISPVKK